jgi:hypothetical protein
MTNVDLFKLIFMGVYAAGVTAASFWFFFAIVFGKIPEDNQQYANLILGFLIGSGVPTFLGYYFGTSQSTKTRPPDLPVGVNQISTMTETTTSTTGKPDDLKEVEFATDKKE